MKVLFIIKIENFEIIKKKKRPWSDEFIELSFYLINWFRSIPNIRKMFNNVTCLCDESPGDIYQIRFIIIQTKDPNFGENMSIDYILIFFGGIITFSQKKKSTYDKHVYFLLYRESSQGRERSSVRVYAINNLSNGWGSRPDNALV